MRLKDILTGPERMELVNIMRNEPVHPGDTISHHTARSLQKRGLIHRRAGSWVVDWDRIKNGVVLDA